MHSPYLIPAWLWTILILVLCLLPGDKMPEDPIVNADKIYHSGAFAVMGFLFVYGFKKQTISSFLNRNAVLLSLLWCIAIGGIIEILQHSFVRNRHGDWLDFLFDAIGTILGVIVLLLMSRYVFTISGIKKR